MPTRIAWLVAATTSAVVLSFVIPLCLLVRTIAEDRAVANANQEASNVAILVSRLGKGHRLADLVQAVNQRSPATTSVLTPAGQVLGSRDSAMPRDPRVSRAQQGNAFTVIGADGAAVLVPVVTGDGTAVVRTLVSGADLHRGVARAWLSIAGLGLLLCVAAVMVAVWLGRRVSTPVTEVAEVAHRLRQGDLAARADPGGPPETVELGDALNRLAERITELLAAERAAVGQLSHRLRTPVTALRLDAEAVSEPEVARRLAAHVANLQRSIDAIVKEARRPVRGGSVGSECDAATVVRDRVDFWAPLAEDQDRTLLRRLPDQPLPAAVDAADLADIVDVLVDNVFAHTPEGTDFSVSLGSDGADMVLVVSDHGPGLTQTGSDRPGSTGLGLQIVRRTVAGLHGRMQARPGPGGGTTIEVRLPAGREPTSDGHRGRRGSEHP